MLRHLGIRRVPPCIPRPPSIFAEIIAPGDSGLVDNGHAYAVNGDVYYRVSCRSPGYGKLSGRSMEDRGSRALPTPGRGDGQGRSGWTLPCGRRRSPASPPGTVPWGKGRPGWHIECSAMSMKVPGRNLRYSLRRTRICCSRTTKTKSPSPSAQRACRLHATGCTTASSISTTRR